MTGRTPNALRRVLGAVRVRTLLAAVFGALLVATVGLTSWLLVRNGDTIVENVIALAAEGAHDGMERQTRRFLSVADQVNDQLALSWASGRIDLADDASTSRLMRDIADVAPEGALSAVGLGFPDGRYVSLTVDTTRAPDTVWRYAFVNDATGGTLVEFEDGRSRAVGSEVARYDGYDPRVRPWYVAALATDGPVWTDVYANFGDGLPTVSRAVAIRDEAGEVVAVALTDLFVRHVQRFLETLPVSSHSEVFVTLPNRRVLAAWSPAAVVPAGSEPGLGAAGPIGLPRSGETAASPRSPDEVIGALVAGPVADLLGARVLPRAAVTGADHVELGGEPGFLFSTRLDDAETPDWALGAFVPERDYLESVPAIVRRVIPLALLILATALATVAGFSALVARPLVRLGDGARRIADGDFDAPVGVRVSNEVGRLAGAIDDMRRGLGASFAALEAERERSTATLDAIGDAVIMTRGDGSVMLLNRAARRLTGWSDADARGRQVHDVVRARDVHRHRPLTRKVLLGAMAESRTVGTSLSLRDAEGRVRPVRCTVSPLGPAGSSSGAVLVLTDLSDAERLKTELAWAASHDALTGLPNRAELERRAARALSAGTGDGTGRGAGRGAGGGSDAPPHALAWVNLDDFQAVNDALGHAGGDELLRQVATTLEEAVGDGVTVARIGGDEFVVLLERRGIGDALDELRAVRDALAGRTFLRDGRSFALAASFGVAPLSDMAGGIAAALRDAERACTRARADGTDRVVVHVEDDGDAADRRIADRWVERLEGALDAGRFELHAQRILPASDRAAPESGPESAPDVEILVRLREENGERSLPGTFLPAAERHGVAARIDRTVVELCFETLGAHPALLDGAVGTVWINLSGRTLGDAHFLDWVQSAFERHGVPPDRIGFEMTETAAVAHPANAERLMRALRELGCRFALDDFGAGMTSFQHLRALPIDVVKIDGGFVSHMRQDARDRALVASIHALAWSFGLTTVAEFVEDDWTLDELRAIGVDRVQGFLLDRPRPLLDLLED